MPHRDIPTRFLPTRALFAVLFAVVAALPAPLRAATFTVDTTQDSVDAMPGDGLCADGLNRCSLRAAVQESNAYAGDDAIALGPGDFLLTIAGPQENAAASGDLDITATLTLDGAGTSATFIDANALDRVFDVAAGAVLHLRKAHVGGGFQAQVSGSGAEISGGGMLVRSGARAELADVVFAGNRSRRMGQAIAVFGSLQATRLGVVENVGKDSLTAAGGLYIGPSATEVALDDCVFDGNQAHQGGAIYGDAAAATITLERCLLAGNSAQNGGGAIVANLGASRWLLRNTTISGNHANAGGALFGDGANQLRFEHCTISGNRASGPNGGGAIFDVRGSANANFVPVELVNTIVSGNTQLAGRECATVFPNVIVSGGGTVHAGGEICRMVAGSGDLVTNDAGLVALADNGGLTRTHALAADSIAVDAAQDGACTTQDQRGHQRPVDGNGDGIARCDIGAYERDDRLFADGFEP